MVDSALKALASAVSGKAAIGALACPWGNIRWDNEHHRVSVASSHQVSPAQRIPRAQEGTEPVGLAD